MFKWMQKNDEDNEVATNIRSPLVSREVELEFVASPKQHNKVKPKSTQLCVLFNTTHSLSNTTLYTTRCEGVVLKTIKVTKYKTPSYIYIVSVCTVDKKKVTPYIKWINKSLCSPTNINLTTYNEQYFNLEWMEQHGKTK